MDVSNYSYSNIDSYCESATIDKFENDSMYVSLRYHNDTYFQDQFYTIEAYSYEHNLDVVEEFNELMSAQKLFNHIKENYSNCDEDSTLQSFTNDLHDYEAGRKPLMLLI